MQTQIISHSNNQINSNSKKYVAYFRVSTKSQGDSGLGLDAQKMQVLGMINESDLLASFTDIESGKKNNRIELNKAIDTCKKSGATLIIAKLDRLSRDAEFLFHLKNSGIDIKACDIPELNTLTLGIYATIAQHERELISKRTIAALAARKERMLIENPEFKHGREFSKEEIQLATKVASEKRSKEAKNNQNNIQAIRLIQSLRLNGLNWNQISIELNNSNYKTSTGGTFSRVSVQRLFERSVVTS